MYPCRLSSALAMAALAAILIPSSLTARITFERTYGGADGDIGRSVEQTADGGYVVGGYTYSYGAGSNDVYLVRTNTAGDTLWTQTIGGADHDWSESVQQTADGGFVLAGTTKSFGVGQQDCYLVKVKPNGDTLWTRTLGGMQDDDGYCVQQTADGGYILVGCTFSFGAGESDVYLVKTDAKGDTLWTRAFGGTSYDYGCSVRQTSDGGYVVAGYTYSFGAGYTDVYLIKTDANGDTLWTRAYGGTLDDYGWSVQQTSDGGYVIAGYAYVSGTGYCDIYLIKTDATGDTLWTRTFGGRGEDQGYSVWQTVDDGFVIAGHTTSFGAGGYDVYLVRTDAGGDTLWTRTFGGTTHDHGRSVRQTADGGYVIAGAATSLGAGDVDLYLIKTDSLGDVGVAEQKTPDAPRITLHAEPNPCRSSTVLHLTTGPLDRSTTLRVFDASGRLVWSEPVRSSSLILHATALPAGAYFLRLDVGNNHATTRVVVQR